MTSQSSYPQSASKRRQLAEEKARHRYAKVSDSIETLSGDDIRALFHELHVHQIELEMQNDELRETQQALEATRQRYFDLYDLAPIGYCTLSENGLILELNLTGATLLEIPRNSLLKRLLTDFIHPEDQDIYYRHRKEFFTTGKAQVCELRMTKTGGEVFWARLEGTIAKVENGDPVCQIMISDISAAKADQDTLKESEEIFNHFMTHSPVYVFFKDHNLRMLKLSRNYEQLLGLPLSEMVGKTMEELFLAGLDINITIDDKKIFEEGKVITTDNTLNNRHYTTIKFPIIIDGTPRYLAGYTIDITERKLAEAQRELLTKAMEQSGETIVITDPRGNIEYVNRTFEQETGHARDTAIGDNMRIMKSGKQDEQYYHHLWSTISKGDTFHGRMVNKSKDGSLFTEDTSISPVFDDTGTIVNYVAVKRNVTEHIQLEESFHQAQKMESIGRLAGGIAHDFNNMLSVILGYTQLVMERVDQESSLHDDLKEIYKAASRSAEITRQLLAFARKQSIVPQILDLNTTVEEMLKMLRRLVGEDIDLYWKPTAKIWLVKMDPSQLDQILANLCVNARDAIAGNGQVTIETKRATFDADYCTTHPGFVPGDYVQLIVSDNGCGMDKETLECAFEPFYTTKGLGEGTGLGLATVYGIVKQNNGFINIYSEPDIGTTFNIYLPAHTGEGELVLATVEPSIPGGHGEIILVVEDESAILRFVKKALDGLGYIVLSASLPSEAIKLAQSHPDTIDLLLTDVIMPEFNGLELAEKIRDSHPETKVLFMSGYTGSVILQNDLLENGECFIQKPLSKVELASKIRAALKK